MIVTKGMSAIIADFPRRLDMHEELPDFVLQFHRKLLKLMKSCRRHGPVGDSNAMVLRMLFVDGL